MNEAPEGAEGTQFPLAVAPMRGYDVGEVERFLERAKRTFEGTIAEDERLSAAELRRASFKLRKRGYEPRFVDAALDRLEEVFFQRERTEYLDEHGEDAWAQLTDSLRRDIIGRLQRPSGDRFRRVGWFAHGYSRTQVDAVLDQLQLAFAEDKRAATSDVRGLRFHLQRRGYDEAQVDAFLDAVVEYFLAMQ